MKTPALNQPCGKTKYSSATLSEDVKKPRMNKFIPKGNNYQKQNQFLSCSSNAPSIKLTKVQMPRVEAGKGRDGRASC